MTERKINKARLLYFFSSLSWPSWLHFCHLYCVCHWLFSQYNLMTFTFSIIKRTNQVLKWFCHLIFLFSWLQVDFSSLSGYDLTQIMFSGAELKVHSIIFQTTWSRHFPCTVLFFFSLNFFLDKPVQKNLAVLADPFTIFLLDEPRLGQISILQNNWKSAAGEWWGCFIGASASWR